MEISVNSIARACVQVVSTLAIAPAAQNLLSKDAQQKLLWIAVPVALIFSYIGAGARIAMSAAGAGVASTILASLYVFWDELTARHLIDFLPFALTKEALLSASIFLLGLAFCLIPIVKQRTGVNPIRHALWACLVVAAAQLFGTAHPTSLPLPWIACIIVGLLIISIPRGEILGSLSLATLTLIGLTLRFLAKGEIFQLAWLTYSCVLFAAASLIFLGTQGQERALRITYSLAPLGIALSVLVSRCGPELTLSRDMVAAASALLFCVGCVLSVAPSTQR